MESWSQWLYETLGIGHSLQYKITASLLVALLVYLLRRFLLYLFLRKKKNLKSRYTWIKTFTYLSFLLIIIIILPIWIKELTSFSTFLGLLTAGLAIALKDPISNFFAWIYILLKKPFEMGDRIQIGDSEGDILDIGFFDFTLLEIKNWVQADQSTGRIIHIPNGLLFTQPVMNYNQAMDFIWNEIPVKITFESNWKKAKKILLEIEETTLQPLMKNVKEAFNEAKKKYYVEYKNLEPTVYSKITENGVQLTLRYLCSPKVRRNSEQMAYEEILNQFAKNEDIQFAYPTTRFYSATEKVKE